MPDTSTLHRIAATATLLLGLFGCGRAQSPPRGVILISLDTLRADYLNLYGYERFETSPFLDRFAEEALVFDHCVVSEPHTLISHMSLLTGLHPQNHRVDRSTALGENITTLASQLRDRGYATAAFADGGYLIPRYGFDRGFDVYEGRKRRGLARILEEARDWLRRYRDFPFFLFLQTYDVHSRGAAPRYRAPAPFEGMFSDGSSSPLADPARPFPSVFAANRDRLSEEDRAYIRATYAEGVRSVDAQLQEFSSFLAEEGLYEDSLIVVWSDHGEGLGHHEDWLHSELYDGTIRCALLMKIPGVDGGRRIGSVVSSVDIAPTLLELVGAARPAGLDGVSFAARLSRDESSGEGFTRVGGGRGFSIRTPTHHLLWDRAADRYELYDLEADPGESRNLSPSDGTIEVDLRRRLHGFAAQHDAQLGRAPKGPPAGLDAEAEEQLRELGYLE